MSSSARLWLLFAFTFTLTSCGLNTGEQAPVRTPPSYSGRGFSCVGKIPENLSKYVNDQLSNEEITTFVNCLQKAFTTFAQLTRGSSATHYSPDEIRRFLHEFFLGERRVSDGLMSEFMVLKQTMLGGKADLISREELYVAIEILEEIKTEAIRLKPHLSVLNPDLAKRQDPATLGRRLNEANGALNSTIQTLAKRLERSPRNYALENLQRLMGEFRAFTGWEKQFPQSIPPQNWVSFLKTFRRLTVAPVDTSVVRPADWAPLLQSFTRWYLVFLQYQIGVKDQPVLQGVGLQNTVQLGQDVFALLEHCISRQPGLTITYPQMRELVAALHGLGWMPKSIRVTSLQSALEATVTRILGEPAIEPDKRRAEGLGLAQLARAREFFYRWVYIQIELGQRFSGGDGAQRIVPNVQLRPYLNPDVQRELQALSSSEVDDFLKIVTETKIRPLLSERKYEERDRDGRVFTKIRDVLNLVREADLKTYGIEHGFANLSAMNMWRTAAQLLLRGYAAQGAARGSWDVGITQKELEKFYAQFREIGIDLTLVDPRNPNMSGRDFTSAKLFTYSGDGKLAIEEGPSRLRMVEVMELFTFLHSGSRLADDIFSDFKARLRKTIRDETDARRAANDLPRLTDEEAERLKLCDADPRADSVRLPPCDLWGRPKFPRADVKTQLPDTLWKMLYGMPGLAASFTDPDKRAQYVGGLVNLAYSNAISSNDWVEYNEFTTLAVIVHYAEAVMTKYDTDGDGVLTYNEINPKAVDNFTGFIKRFAHEKLGKKLGDWEAASAFYFILIENRFPTGFTDIAWLSYVGPDESKLRLNRERLAGVFDVILRRLFSPGDNANAPVKEIPPPPIRCMGTDIVIPENCIP